MPYNENKMKCYSKLRRDVVARLALPRGAMGGPVKKQIDTAARALVKICNDADVAYILVGGMPAHLGPEVVDRALAGDLLVAARLPQGKAQPKRAAQDEWVNDNRKKTMMW